MRVLISLLAGCGMGTFETRDGNDEVRAALYFAPESALTLELYDARQVYLLLANSTVPCWPDDVEDDPRTPTLDEEAAAQSYWEAQLLTAFSRENALAVAMTLSVDATSDWIGRYSLHEDAWDQASMERYVATDQRVAAGAWYRVVESSNGDNSGVLYAADVSVDEEAYDLEVGAPAWVDVEAKDTELVGTFDFAPTKLGGSFIAERCDNLDLLELLYLRLAVLALADADDSTLIEF